MGWGTDRAAKAAVKPGPVAAAPAPAVPAALPASKGGPKKVTDPLDPDAFNQEFHPDRKEGAAGKEKPK